MQADAAQVLLRAEFAQAMHCFPTMILRYCQSIVQLLPGAPPIQIGGSKLERTFDHANAPSRLSSCCGRDLVFPVRAAKDRAAGVNLHCTSYALN